MGSFKVHHDMGVVLEKYVFFFERFQVLFFFDSDNIISKKKEKKENYKKTAKKH